MAKDLVNNVKITTGLVPATRTADTLSSACDRQGYQSVAILFHIGAIGDTASGSVYAEAELQESDDNSTYTPVANADLLFKAGRSAASGSAVGTFFQSKTTGAADTGSATYIVGYRGTKRYLKVNYNVTGTHTNGTPVAVTFVLSHADYAPAP